MSAKPIDIIRSKSSEIEKLAIEEIIGKFPKMRFKGLEFFQIEDAIKVDMVFNLPDGHPSGNIIIISFYPSNPLILDPAIDLIGDMRGDIEELVELESAKGDKAWHKTLR